MGVTPAQLLERYAWPAVVGLAVVVRVAAWQAFPGVFDFVATGTIHGSEAYDHYAQNLVATGTYGREAGVPDAAIPPLYSLLLAVAYFVAERSAATVVLLHTAFDVGSMALLRGIAGRLFGRTTIGTVAALGMAVYPYFVFQALAVNDTSLFVLLVHAFIWLVVRLRQPERGAGAMAWSAAAGLVLGLATLTRPVILPLALGAAAWWLLWLPARAVGLRLAVVGLAASVVVGAWTIRNERVLGVPVVVATNGGSNFWQGNNALSRAYLDAGYDVQWIPAGPLARLDYRDPASNAAFLAEGLRFWREQPGELPSLLWTKIKVHWSLDVAPRKNPVPESGTAKGLDRVRALNARDGSMTLSGLAARDAVSVYSQPLFDRYGRLVHRAYWGTALALALAGIWATRRAWRDASLIWLVQINMTLTYLVFHPSTRYRLPADPLLMLFSAAGLLLLVALAHRLRLARHPR